MAFQFFISLLLLIGTLAINSQLNYVQNKRLGFDKDHLVRFTLGRDIAKTDYQPLINELKRLSGVEEISHGTPQGMTLTTFVYPEGLPLQSEGVESAISMVDYSFIATMGIKLAEGRAFDPDRRLDSVNAIIINQSAAKKFGWEDPIGKIVRIKEPDFNTGKHTLVEKTVVGLIEDYHFRSLKFEISPMILQLESRPAPYSIIMRFSNVSPQNLISGVESVWKKFVQIKPLNYVFLDEYLESNYKSEARLSRIFFLFTGLAIFLAILGLLGIFSNAAENRRKEIGIRKVLGASVMRIVFLLVNDYNKLILVSSVFALPVAWYAVSKWLENFAYKAPITGWLFFEALLLVIVVTWSALVYQVVKSTFEAPVRVLKED